MEFIPTAHRYMLFNDAPLCHTPRTHDTKHYSTFTDASTHDGLLSRLTLSCSSILWDSLVALLYISIKLFGLTLTIPTTRCILVLQLLRSGSHQLRAYGIVLHVNTYREICARGVGIFPHFLLFHSIFLSSFSVAEYRNEFFFILFIFIWVDFSSSLP